MHEEVVPTMALAAVPGLGRQRFYQLMKKIGPPSRVFEMSTVELKSLGLTVEARVAVASRKALALAEEELRSLRSKGIRVLSLFDECYPCMLSQIYDPPPLLYYLGNIELLGKPAVALVGSRRCSVYGREVALRFGRDLSALGLTVVSGLARGIDTHAHAGALSAGGPTVAVLGNGVDVPYPRENRSLYSRIRTEGCLLSEFPCGSFPAPQNFPVRNRIIAGLCYGTIIGEASEFSGSLITARLTLEQNRELWAIPGNITNPGSYGPNYLIKQGAHPVMSAQDVLEDLPVSVLDWLSRTVTPSSSAEGDRSKRSPPADLDPQEKRVLEKLSPEFAVHVDRLQEEVGIPTGLLSEILLKLELKGRIRQLPGRMFSARLC